MEVITVEDKRKTTEVDEDYSFVSNNKLTQFERELVINYCEYDKVWVAETSIPKFWRRFEKKGWICTGTQYYADGTVCSKTFTSGNSKGISITDPNKTRVLTDEQRAAAAERFKTMWKKTNAEDEGADDNE